MLFAVASVGTPADASSATTYAAVTRVNGTPLPVPTVSGEWRTGDREATLTVKVANAAPAETVVTAGWTSPFARARGRCFGQFSYRYKHHGPPSTPTAHVTDLVRYRVEGGRWSRWFTEHDEEFEESGIDYGVGEGRTNDCVFFFWSAPRKRLQLEVRQVTRYVGTTRTTEELGLVVP